MVRSRFPLLLLERFKVGCFGSSWCPEPPVVWSVELRLAVQLGGDRSDLIESSEQKAELAEQRGSNHVC